MGKLKSFFAKILHDATDGIRRFPLTSLFVTWLSIYGILMIELNMSEDFHSKLMICIGTAIPLSLIYYFLMEGFKNTNIIWKIIGNVLCLVLPFLYYFALDMSGFGEYRIAYVIIALTLFAFIIPSFFVEETHEKFLLKIFTRVCVSLLYGLVLAGGITLIYFAFDSLIYSFDHSEVYVYIWILFFGLFAALYFLAGIPRLVDEEEYDYPAFIRILIAYIFMPLILAFSLVLLGYFIKVLASGIMPKGVIVWLSFAFSAVSTKVIYMSRPLEQNIKIVKITNMIAPKVVFLFLAMATVAIRMRTQQYGITIDRYFVYAFIVVFALWGIVLNLPCRFKLAVPAILALMLVVSVYGGPINAREISYRSQSRLLADILVNNDMLEGDTIIPNAGISKEDQNIISDKVSYLKGNEMEKGSFRYQGKDIALEDDFARQFGFASTRPGERESREKYVSLAIDKAQPISIQGYSIFCEQRYSMYQNQQEYPQLTVGNEQFNVSIENGLLTLANNQNESYSIALKLLAGVDEKAQPISIEKMTFGGEGRYRLIAESIYFQYHTDTEEVSDLGVNLYVLRK